MSNRELLKRVKSDLSNQSQGTANWKLQQQRERTKNKPKLP